MFSLNTPPRSTLQKNLRRTKTEITPISANQPETLPDSQKITQTDFQLFTAKKTKVSMLFLYIPFSEQKSLHFNGSGFSN
jgi:hypothetical protein